MIITLLRKPLEGTVAENTLKHGCGAINIDATRIGTGHHLPLGKVTSKRLAGDGGLGAGSGREGKRENFTPRVADGRWPANFILTHQEGCELKGTKKIKGNRVDSRPEGDGGRADKSEWRFRPTSATKRGYSDGDGEETVANWACVEDCPVKELDREIKSGGASRFFKQFKKGND